MEESFVGEATEEVEPIDSADEPVLVSEDVEVEEDDSTVTLVSDVDAGFEAVALQALEGVYEDLSEVEESDFDAGFEAVASEANEGVNEDLDDVEESDYDVGFSAIETENAAAE